MSLTFFRGDLKEVVRELPLRIRLWIGKRLFANRSLDGFLICVSPKRVVKLLCREAELEGLRFVAANTTIPLPRVHRVHQCYGKLAIEMEYIPGCRNIWACWKDLTEEQKASVVDDVAGFIRQMRTLSPPAREYQVSSTDGGPCRDIRVATGRRFGPCKDVAAFHMCVRAGMSLEGARSSFGDKVARIHERSYDVKFTHGDLAPQNILIRDGRVAAVIDWECAGWYPEYWEYTKFHYNRIYCTEYCDRLAQAVTRYDKELEAERELWRWHDQPLDEFPLPQTSEERPKKGGRSNTTDVLFAN